MFARLSLFDDGRLLAELQVRPTWNDQIKEKQLLDESLVPHFGLVENGETVDFSLNSEGVLCFRGRVCVPRDSDLKQSILQEVHRLRREVPDFVGKCLTCQKVKVEHQLPSRLLQPVKIPLWKWVRATMDFVSGLALTPTNKDSELVIADQLTKSAHFIPVHTDYSL
ncbi:uncharacterized protein LOC108485049 [Gossypium arboreum]|uniref:uncharacterized protein LOC108485049 n=1 Tax=Gossypium arboreum TaxID=29729 RepID=UPI00081924C6|nr:uncharacterized protein LOC108485049 [Gossypium arboreum]